ncbi:MAG: hypothetical protein KBD78_02010 [Oligoflexales bacterium]|nr:hypothetical protein [Oligoflexales bacterium]
MQALTVAILVGFVLGVASPAYARRDQRKGFNFGSSIGLSNIVERGSVTDSVEFTGRNSTDSQSINPYFGYSLNGVVNVGATFTLLNRKTEAKQSNLDKSIEVVSESDAALKSGSLFARLLFGKVLYLEFGGGLYHQTSKETRSENQIQADNASYSGQRQVLNSKGVGSGYHFGAGLEIPVTIGFYITSAYNKHLYQLRDIKGSDVGGKKSFHQRSELSFGVAYYYQ